MKFRLFSFAACTIAFSSAVFAQDVRIGDIHIDHSYARATVAGQTSGAAYLTLENKGRQADALIAVQSSAATSSELHTMSMTDDHVMRMREVASIELKSQDKITMKPGAGYHIMLLGLKAPLKAGDQLPLTLTFKKAGEIKTSVPVEDGKPKDADHKGHGHHH